MQDYDIHSTEFYNYMAQAKADLNGDGVISGEQETSIFNNYLKTFERDGENGLSQKDVDICKSEYTFSEAEKKAQKDLKLFKDTHDTSHLANLSKEDLDKFERLLDSSNLKKRINVYRFTKDAGETFEYLLNHGKIEELDKYERSFKNYYQNEE